MTDAAWKPDYAFLTDFWDIVLAPRTDRTWRVYTISSDVLACDGSALELLRERLRERGQRVECHYVHAWASEHEAGWEDMAGRDMFFLGRTRPFGTSRVGPYANRLANNVRASFIDEPYGLRGRRIRYGSRVFEAEELNVPPLEGRCRVDYAVLGYCMSDIGFERRALVGVSGVSSFATWGMMRVLTDDARRLQLVKDVQAIAPWTDGLHPEQGFDICVRFSVDGDEQLKNILNDQRFDFQVEAVTVSGGESHLRDYGLLLVLRPEPRRGGGSVTAGQPTFWLRDFRFRLLQALVESNKPVGMDALCDELGFVERDPSPQDVQRAKQRVARAVFDLNNILSHQIPGLSDEHPVKSGPGGYRLVGLRGVVEKTR